MILGHLDLDAFFAAVEELEDPELRAKPLVVGGDPHGRGVVATANYEARKFGIHSAMSCAEALRRCPHAVFVRPRHSLYSEYSQAVWKAIREVVPTVERTGKDEGYLDLGEIAADFGKARALAEAVQTSVRGSTSLTCSIGVSTCKVVSKIASDLRKPGGLVVVPPGREASFLAPFDIRKLPGIGPRSEARFRAAGVDTIGALAALTDDELRRLLPGKVGGILRQRARGIDRRALETSSERVSISHEETFPKDIADRDQLKDELRRMSDEPGRLPAAKRRDRQNRDDEGALLRLLDPQPLDLDSGRHRRRRANRRARVRVPRPRTGRSARRATTRRGRHSPGSSRTSSSRWSRLPAEAGRLECRFQRARGEPGTRRREVVLARSDVVGRVGVEERRQVLNVAASGAELELAAAVGRDALLLAVVVRVEESLQRARSATA